MTQAHLTRRRFATILGGAFLLSISVLLLAPLVGPIELSLPTALSDGSSLDAEILLRARLPRVLFAALVGGALAVSGVVFQAILRNPLASPFTLGVSGGGSLGAVLAILLGWEVSFHGISFLPLASLAGATTVVLIVYSLSKTQRHFSPLTLLLSGVVLNYICAALILLVHYFSNFTKSFMMMRWMMGALDVYDFGVVMTLLPFILIGLALLLRYSRYLNVLSAGEDWAASRGVQVERLVTLQYFGASLLTGSVVAYCGPIGFVGLIVPHILRLLLGADHRILLPTAFLMGGTFLVICDTIARTVLAPTEIPVGIFTSILGGPFFLWLLLHRRKELFFGG
ncbi:MAG: iron ABC transporter permease [Acidobacteriota bacterium]|nr:MAG: iron ABC transporter permease [Acidobacteriota bacterium]